ncbi:MAG: hypothetical protein NC087_05095 [Anaeroplasma bactoclasticum]|nr:hypothetical protein [Anaeroplasma bactoclasticum]
MSNEVKEVFVIKKLDTIKDVCSEKLTARITPELKEKVVAASNGANRTISNIVKLCLEWALDRMVIEE